MSGTREGRSFACDGTDVFTIRDGLVARKDTYVDWLTYQQQTGVDLAPETESEQVPEDTRRAHLEQRFDEP